MEDKTKQLYEFLSLVQVDGFEFRYDKDITQDKYFSKPIDRIIHTERILRQPGTHNLAYFSMEYGLATSFYNAFSTNRAINPDNLMPQNTVFSNFRLADYFFDVSVDRPIDLPIYSGGLGVLAGDTVKTMADYKLPAVAVGILWRSGYFRQRFWFKYGQVPEKTTWDPHTYPGLIPLKNTVKIQIRNETIFLKLWKYYVYSYSQDFAVPLILLDADIEPNRKEVRSLTEQLYRSDNSWTRIMQRVILGFGGVAALKELGYDINLYHLNEGHAVFAFLEKARGLSNSELVDLGKQFKYTCHTPVEAGHDRFSQDELRNVLLADDFDLAQTLGADRGGSINLTLLAMNASSSINAVAKSHQRVMCLQFPRYKDKIKFVTNGVHPYTWTSEESMDLYKKYSGTFADIEHNPAILEKAKELKDDSKFRRDVWKTHQKNKESLCAMLEKWNLSADIFTICWARRIAAYKRPSLILHDVRRLIEISKTVGPLQVILAGKSHPNDNIGFTFVNEMMDKVDLLIKEYDFLKVIILENYDIYFGKVLSSGVDVWLNNPLPPFEASGTSGMKALHNGVIQLSTLDGWVVEAENKGIGKIFGYKDGGDKIGSEYDLHIEDDALELYQSLEEMARLYYKTHNAGKTDLSTHWLEMMINCISASAHFNTYRMLDEYKHLVWNIR